MSAGDNDEFNKALLRFLENLHERICNIERHLDTHAEDQKESDRRVERLEVSVDRRLGRLEASVDRLSAAFKTVPVSKP